MNKTMHILCCAVLFAVMMGCGRNDSNTLSGSANLNGKIDGTDWLFQFGRAYKNSDGSWKVALSDSSPTSGNPCDLFWIPEGWQVYIGAKNMHSRDFKFDWGSEQSASLVRIGKQTGNYSAQIQLLKGNGSVESFENGTITGNLDLKNDQVELKGRFTATVCN